MNVDGREVVIYADTCDGEDLVAVDVFVDGRSLYNQAPIGTLAARRARTGAESAAWVSPLDPYEFVRSGLVAMRPIGVGFGGAIVASRALDHPLIAVAVSVGAYSASVVALTYLLGHQLTRLPSAGLGRRLGAVTIGVIALAGTVSAAVLVLIGPLAPAG